MTKNNICCIFNFAPHYRGPIYELMDKELNCDFYLGDDFGAPIKEMDLSKLKGFKKKMKRRKITRWNHYWFSGCFEPIFKPYKYYIISGNSKFLSCWFLLLISKFSSKKIYAWTHGIRGDKSKIQTKIDTLFFKLCDKVLLYGHYPKNKMINLGIPENKLEIIYNSLDYEKQLKYRIRTSDKNIYKNYFNNSHPVILYIGRLQKSKKLEVLLDLKKKLMEENININIVFIGKDIGDNNLVSEVDKSDFSKEVWFYGPCYEESSIAQLIQQAELCISPGPIGLTAIHVANYGLPIITNDNFIKQMPEFEVIEDGKNGAFYKDGDLESLVSQTKLWLKKSVEKKAIAKEFSETRIDKYYNPKYQVQLMKRLTQP